MKEIEAWLARDYNGSIYVYINKPKKLDDTWSFNSFGFFKLEDSLFPEVKWADEEPTKVKLIIDK